MHNTFEEVYLLLIENQFAISIQIVQERIKKSNKD